MKTITEATELQAEFRKLYRAMLTAVRESPVLEQEYRDARAMVRTTYRAMLDVTPPMFRMPVVLSATGVSLRALQARGGRENHIAALLFVRASEVMCGLYGVDVETSVGDLLGLSADPSLN